LKISARNTFTGTVSSITKGAVNTEVTLTLKGDVALTAIVTNGSVDTLNLATGKEARAIVKAGSIIVGANLHDVAIKALACDAQEGATLVSDYVKG
jgi:molybdate transport system regulatory protein